MLNNCNRRPISHFDIANLGVVNRIVELYDQSEDGFQALLSQLRSERISSGIKISVIACASAGIFTQRPEIESEVLR